MGQIDRLGVKEAATHNECKSEYNLTEPSTVSFLFHAPPGHNTYRQLAHPSWHTPILLATTAALSLVHTVAVTVAVINICIGFSLLLSLAGSTLAIGAARYVMYLDKHGPAATCRLISTKVGANSLQEIQDDGGKKRSYKLELLRAWVNKSRL